MRGDTDEAFAPGTVLGGSYRLVRRLGRGGMGDIHLASHERLPGQFVVKVLNADLVNDQDAFVRFRQEAIVMANIRHPNVVQLVDFNMTIAGLPFLVMEYLPGKDLAEVLTARPFLAATQVSTIVRQVACALDAAHRLGIVHRDLKPENIMVVPCEGQGDLIKVIDFGISKARRFNHVTSASMVMGTPEFMSPEQAQGKHEEIDARSDQFALAVISYLLLTGRTPWGVTAPMEILHRVVNNDPLPLTHDETWRSVESVLLRAMSKLPADRYPSTLAFWRALDRAMISDGLLPATHGYEPALHVAGAETSSVPSLATDHAQPASAPDEEGAVGWRAASVPAETISAPVESLSLLDDTTDALSRPLIPTGGDCSGGQNQQDQEDQEDQEAASVTTRLPVVKARHRRRRVHGLEVLILLAVLAVGTYVGLGGLPPGLRARVDSGWNAFGNLAARAAERGIGQGQRLMSKASKTSKAYLSLGSEP